MTSRTWIGGNSENNVTDPANWSPSGFDAGDTLILQGGTVLVTGPNPVLNGATADPLLVANGGNPVINLYDLGNISIAPQSNGSGNVTINAGGEASVRFEGDTPTLTVASDNDPGFNLSVNMLETAGLVMHDSMGAGTLTVNGSGGTLIFFGTQDFRGTHVSVNTHLGSYATSATAAPGLIYLSQGASFELNAGTGYDLFTVGEDSQNNVSASSLILDPAAIPATTFLVDGFIELKGFQAYQGSTPGAWVNRSNGQITVLNQAGSPAIVVTDRSGKATLVQTSQGLFIETPDVPAPAGGTQVNLGITDTGVARGTSGAVYSQENSVSHSWAINTAGQITVDGTVDPTSANVELLVSANGQVWQENNQDLWWSKASVASPWVAYTGSGAPVPLPTPASADGTTVAAGSSAAIQDANGNLWGIVNGQVTVNGSVDPTTANVVQLDFSGGQVWQENSSNLWWYKTAPANAWTQGGNPQAAPPAGMGAYGPANSFLVTDQTNGGAWQAQGSAYSGPVAGLAREIVLATSDNVSVMAETPNVFIHSGGGEDGLNVSQVNGNNILDGSTGSNFLIGGTGTDQFYVDDRNPAAVTWSSLVNFHSGDNATVWGITQAGFSLSWLDGQGAAGATGLTGVFQKAGQPDAAVTLAGYTSADLTNGRLTVSYGRTQDLPGVPGSDYVTIHAN